MRLHIWRAEWKRTSIISIAGRSNREVTYGNVWIMEGSAANIRHLMNLKNIVHIQIAWFFPYGAIGPDLHNIGITFDTTIRADKQVTGCGCNSLLY